MPAPALVASVSSDQTFNAAGDAVDDAVYDVVDAAMRRAVLDTLEE